MTVVDASVVLQWLLAEPSSASQAVLKNHIEGHDSLVAPELLYYEVGNVLVTKSALDSAAVSDLFTHFLDLDVHTYSLGAEEYNASIDLASRYKLTVYDASYVILALNLKCHLVTADRRLARRIDSLGMVQAV